MVSADFAYLAAEVGRVDAAGRTGCGHGSSLSPAMHGMVAARLGRSDLALRYFQRAAAIDLADTSAAIDGGVHIAALAASG